MTAAARALEFLTLTEQIEAAKFDVKEACTPRGQGAMGTLHIPQFKCVNDNARFIVACLPRRSGKTMMEAIRAVRLCTTKPNAVVWYLGFGISYGIDTFTDGCLRGLLKRFDITAEVKEGGGYIEFPNGSSISIRGVDDQHAVEKLRGRNPPDLVFLDECFPAGTLIDGRPIESIKIGDTVSCVDHSIGKFTHRQVVRVFTKIVADYLVSVRLSPGRFSSTATHPVFVRGKGYVYARDLVPGDMLCVRRAREVAEGQPAAADMLQGMSAQAALAGLQRAQDAGMVLGDAQARLLGEQPHAQEIGANQSLADAQAHGAQAADSGWQWQGPHGGAADLGQSATMEDGSDSQDRPSNARSAIRIGVSELLQAGSGGREVEDMYRGRWSDPREPGEEAAGREEDSLLEWARVESVSSEEPRGAHGLTVYNFEVEGAHTYFANDVLVHNCQSMNERLLRPMVDNIIRPALLDRAGTLIITGTPSPVPAGFFYDTWDGRVAKAWSHHSWTLYDNPTKAKAFYDAFLAKERADRGITEADPAYRREWLGEWAIEEELRVYKYGAINNVQGDVSEFELANGIKGRRCITRHPLMSTHNKHLWRHAVGIDIGSGDRTAIVVLGQHLNDTHIYQAFEWVISRKQEPVQSDIVDVLKFVRAEYAPLNWFFDSGGAGGKLFMTTLQRDHGFPLIEAAKKTDRRGQIDSVNTWLRRGQLLIPSVSAVAEDMLKSIWNADKLKEGIWEYSPTWHPDPAEALRYCATGIHPWFYKAKIWQSKKQEWQQAEERSIEAEMIAPPMGGLVDGDVSLEDQDAAAFGGDGWSGM